MRIDYEAAGIQGPEEMNARLIELLCLVEMEEDVYRFGLSGTVDPEQQAELAQGILEARAALVDRLAEQDASDLVVRFDPDAYNRNATLGENLLFGTPTKPEYQAAGLAENPLQAEVLEQLGLTNKVLGMGLIIAKNMVEIFADLPPGHPFFEQFSFIEADDLPEYRILVTRAEKVGVEKLSEAESCRLLALPFKYVEARHRLDLIGEEEEEQFVAARRLFAEKLAETDPGAVEPYRPDDYNAAASLLDNVLFGRLAYGQAQAEEIVGAAVTEVLDRLELRSKAIEVGLDYNVGVGGKRLSPTQRQKLAIARALLKRPEVLILNEATAVMDSAAHSRIQDNVLKAREGLGVIWMLPRAQAAESFDNVLVLQNGRLVEQGEFAELNKPDTAFGALLHAG